MPLEFKTYDDSQKYLKLGFAHLNNDGTVYGQSGAKSSKHTSITALLYETGEKLNFPEAFNCEVNMDEDYEAGTLKAKIKKLTEKYWSDVYKAVEKHGISELNEALYKIGFLPGEKSYPDLMLELYPPEPEEQPESEETETQEGQDNEQPDQDTGHSGDSDPSADSDTEVSGEPVETEAGTTEGTDESQAGEPEAEGGSVSESVDPDSQEQPNA